MLLLFSLDCASPYRTVPHLKTRQIRSAHHMLLLHSSDTCLRFFPTRACPRPPVPCSLCYPSPRCCTSSARAPANRPSSTDFFSLWSRRSSATCSVLALPCITATTPGNIQHRRTTLSFAYSTGRALRSPTNVRITPHATPTKKKTNRRSVPRCAPFVYVAWPVRAHAHTRRRHAHHHHHFTRTISLQ